MERNKTVRRGWKRKHAVKANDEKEKEQEEGDSKHLFFVTLHFLFTQIQTKKLLFAGLHTPVHSHTRQCCGLTSYTKLTQQSGCCLLRKPRLQQFQSDVLKGFLVSRFNNPSKTKGRYCSLFMKERLSKYQLTLNVCCCAFEACCRYNFQQCARDSCNPKTLHRKIAQYQLLFY